MARIPRLKLPVLLALEAAAAAEPQLTTRFIERAEALAGELDPAVTSSPAYPAEYIAFRISGRRDAIPVLPRDAALLSPAALLDELSAFCERLSIKGRLPDPDHREFLTLEELCQLWNVSEKTIARLRHVGLIARRVGGGKNGVRSRLVFRREIVNRFAQRHADRLGRAGRTQRLGRTVEDRILRRAARYHRLLGWSAHACAQRLSFRYTRSPETIRQLILRRAAEIGLIPDTGMLDSRRRKVLWRAWRLGFTPTELGRRYGRSAGAVRRAIHVRRADLLRALLVEPSPLRTHEGPMFTRDNAEEVLLAPQPVRAGLGAPGAIDLAELLRSMRDRRPPVGVEESTRAVAHAFLTWWCAGAISRLSEQSPSPVELDRVETRLLWCARLKAELIRPHLRLVLETIEGRLGQKAEELPPRVLPELLLGGIEAAADGIGRFDPFAAGRAAAAVALAVDRFAARVVRDDGPVRRALAHQEAGRATGPKRATVILGAATPGFGLADWTRSVCPWQAWLEPDRRWRGLVSRGRVAGEIAEFMAARYGWNGERPMELDELRGRFGLTAIRAPLFEQRARRTMAAG